MIDTPVWLEREFEKEKVGADLYARVVYLSSQVSNSDSCKLINLLYFNLLPVEEQVKGYSDLVQSLKSHRLNRSYF